MIYNKGLAMRDAAYKAGEKIEMCIRDRVSPRAALLRPSVFWDVWAVSARVRR